MDTALSQPVGQLLGGRYHVGSRIARGGMATVYLGTDTRLDRVIALKIAHPELSDDAEFVRRFIGEARSAARLSSPNVVGIFDQGSDKRLHYIAMEYVPGRTLRQLLNERGRLSPREALDVLSGVLAGLAAAHEAGIAHRDVKPENVLMTASGAVKVADFGLARAVAGAVQTKGGMIIGTAAYLAPEQVAGGTSDARTDVYAAGIMLFELLTGVQPHTADSPLAVAYKHVNEVVPAPSSVLPELSGSVDALVAMATSRDPDLRPANAGQFLRAIEGFRDGQGQSRTSGYADSGSAEYQPAAAYPPAAFSGSGAYPGQAPYPGYPSGAEPGSYSGPVAYPAADSYPGRSSQHSSSQNSEPYLAAASYPGPASPSGPYDMPGLRSASAPFQAPAQDGSGPYPTPYPGTDPYATDDDRGAGRGNSARGFQPDRYDGYGGDQRQPSGPVGASALPSLSSQSAAVGPVRPVPHADVEAQANHTLVVSETGLLGSYSDTPSNAGFSGDGGRYGRRMAHPRLEPRLQGFLFSRKLAYASGVLAVMLLITFGAWWLSSGRYQLIPNLRAASKATAITELKNLGLRPTLGKPHNNPLPKGEVIQSLPHRDSQVPSGGTVKLIISLGPVMLSVPQVSGQQLSAAQAALRAAGLTPGTVSQGTVRQAVSSSVQAGYVISTIPRAYAKCPRTRPVVLIESAGPGLPNFVGAQVSDAQAAGASGGYTINAVANAKGSQPANTIVRQSPGPNTPITAGEVVTVYYSPGPPGVPVPDVRGMDVNQATQVLQQAGFQVTVSQSGPGNKVGRYDPMGTQPKGTLITLYVGLFNGGF